MSTLLLEQFCRISFNSSIIIHNDMGYLADKLVSYYEQKGNKIIFCGKYSLNELAFELWERLEYKGIDSSSLSRIITGKRLFTLKQLKIFCDVLNISPSASKELEIALSEDMLTRYGFSIELKNDKANDFSSLLEENVLQAKKLRERGLVEFIPDWIDGTITMLESIISKENTNLYSIHNINSLVNAYYEKAYAYGCIYPGKESYKKVYPIITRLLVLAQDNKDSGILIKANTLLSYNCYILAKDSTNVDKSSLFHQGYNAICETLKSDYDPDEISLMAWRCLMLNSIYLNDYSTFKHSSQKVMEIIRINNDNPNMSFIIWALSSIARGQSYFKDKGVEQTLEYVKKFDDLIPWVDPLRTCALLRNEIEVLDNLDSQNETYKKKLAKKGLAISQSLNYLRYTKYFSKSLEN